MVNQCRVGSCVLKNYPFLKELSKTSSVKKRKNIIKNASPCEIAALSECCYNIAKGNFHLTPARVIKLKKHAPIIRKIAHARDVDEAKKIIQTGDGFPFAPILIPILLEATRHLFGK